jgi:hypothetical protein
MIPSTALSEYVQENSQCARSCLTLLSPAQFEKIFAITLPSRTDHLDAIALAAAFTGLDIDIIDGVDGNSVPAKALPPDSAAAHLSPGSIGSWRAHLNALRT